MIEYSQEDSSKDVVKNTRKINGDSLQLISKIEKNLNNFNLENIIKQLEERGISFSKEETEKVSQSLGITNLTQEKAQEIQKPINEQNKDDEGR